MKINKIEITNFGSYEGLNEFDFSSTTDNKNIVLIGGKNGAGKTTLFNAIKIALYGPFALGYQTTTVSYISNIKKFINNNSLKKEDVNTSITLDFDIGEDRGITNYIINRKWRYEKTKLIESLTVTRGSELLIKDQLDSFENYIRSLIPPELFELFFFDGERISDFFLNSNSNKNLKEAVLVLCGFDTFEIMQNNFKRNINMKNHELLSEEEISVIELNQQLQESETNLQKEETSLFELTKNIQELKEQKQVLEDNFRKSGGLLADEISKLKNQIAYEERFREEKNEWLKNYANEILPFVIVKDLVMDVKHQIKKENDYNRYKAIKGTLSSSLLEKLLREEKDFSKINITDEKGNNGTILLSTLLAKHIDSKIRPDFDIDNFNMIHCLSIDEENNVLSIIRDLELQDTNDLVKCKSYIDDSIKRAQKIRSKLEKSDNNNQLTHFIEDLSKTESTIMTLLVEKEQINNKIIGLKLQIDDLKAKCNKAKDNYLQRLKDESITSISIKGVAMLEIFIPKLIKQKLEVIKTNFLYMFKQLISKQYYVDDIDIDEEFNITLYRNGVVTIEDLRNLITNIGLNNLSKHLGEKCVQFLASKFKVNSLEDLETAIFSYMESIIIEIPTKVEISSFSKGEQQIYIMSLYWSIIKLNKNNIPFIIDTPYARIDGHHRENITTKFFPSLSSQVIVLSTDEEINEQYYGLIKPFVSSEYVIKYSDQEKRTIVDNKYFFEVA